MNIKIKNNSNTLVSLIITILFICFCIAFYYVKAKQYSVDAFENKADYYFYKENYVDSIKYYKKLLNIGKYSNKIYLNLAISLIKIGDYEHAIKYLNVLLKTRKDIPETYYLLAYANYYKSDKDNINKDNIKHIISYLEKSIELNEKYKLAYSLIGKIYEQIGLYEYARTWYRKALFSGIENSEEFYGFIAHTYFKESKFDNAIKYYKKAIEKNKNYISAYCSIADIYAIQKEYYMSELMYKEVIEKDKDYILPYYKIGKLYYLQGNYNDAIEWYKKALNINKDNGQVNYYLGISYKKLNNLQEALKYLKNAAYCGNDDAVKELRTIQEII